MRDGQIDGLVERDAYRSLGACRAKHGKPDQNGSYSVLRLLHIPFKNGCLPLPPRAASAKADFRSELPAAIRYLPAAPGTAIPGQGVTRTASTEREFYRLGGGRT